MSSGLQNFLKSWWSNIQTTFPGFLSPASLRDEYEPLVAQHKDPPPPYTVSIQPGSIEERDEWIRDKFSDFWRKNGRTPKLINVLNELGDKYNSVDKLLALSIPIYNDPLSPHTGHIFEPKHINHLTRSPMMKSHAEYELLDHFYLRGLRFESCFLITAIDEELKHINERVSAWEDGWCCHDARFHAQHPPFDRSCMEKERPSWYPDVERQWEWDEVVVK